MPKFSCILLIVISQLVISCSVQQSYLTGSHCNGKCTYLRMGVGRAQAVSFWGMGGHKTENLVFTAKNNMYRTFPLHRTEFYDNFVVSIRNIYFPLIKKTVVTIHADIVTDDIAEGDMAFSDSYREYLGQHLPNRWGIELADSVVFVKGGKLWRGVVIDLTEHKATVMQVQNGIEHYFSMPIKKLFAIENESLEDECGCEAGEVLEISSTAGNDPKVVKIAGLQKGRKLITISQKNKLRFKVVPFTK